MANNIYRSTNLIESLPPSPQSQQSCFNSPQGSPGPHSISPQDINPFSCNNYETMQKKFDLFNLDTNIVPPYSSFTVAQRIEVLKADENNYDNFKNKNIYPRNLVLSNNQIEPQVSFNNPNSNNLKFAHIINHGKSNDKPDIKTTDLIIDNNCVNKERENMKAYGVAIDYQNKNCIYNKSDVDNNKIKFECNEDIARNNNENSNNDFNNNHYKNERSNTHGKITVRNCVSYKNSDKKISNNNCSNVGNSEAIELNNSIYINSDNHRKIHCNNGLNNQIIDSCCEKDRISISDVTDFDITNNSNNIISIMDINNKIDDDNSTDSSLKIEISSDKGTFDIVIATTDGNNNIHDYNYANNYANKQRIDKTNENKNCEPSIDQTSNISQTAENSNDIICVLHNNQKPNNFASENDMKFNILYNSNNNSKTLKNEIVRENDYNDSEYGR